MKRVFVLMLAAAVFCTGFLPAAAFSESSGAPSPWAADEIEQAVELGFVPEALLSDYQAPVTRSQFIELALNFLSVQYHYGGDFDYSDFCEPTPSIKANYKQAVFTDAQNDDDVNWACALGIVGGRGDGTFGPLDCITRQEAAKILMNTYAVYGGEEAAEEANAAPFSDEANIASWARDSVSILWEWRVFNGCGGGLFSPSAKLTREQCIVAFLRLYENAPVSRARDNVAPMVSYEGEMDRVLSGVNGSSYCIHFIQDSDEFFEYTTGECTVLYGPVSMRNAPHNSGYGMCLIYLNGGRRWLPLPRDNFYSTSAVKNIYFSDDETMLSYQVTFPERSAIDVGLPSETIFHEKGTYYYTVDLHTAKVTLTIDPNSV